MMAGNLFCTRCSSVMRSAMKRNICAGRHLFNFARKCKLLKNKQNHVCRLMHRHCTNSASDSSSSHTGWQTVDEEEMRKFATLASEWWDEKGEFEALHAMNNLRVPLIRDALIQKRQGPSACLSRPLEGFSVLDAGSGGGLLTEPLARLGAFVVGIDSLEENIQVASTHLTMDPEIAGRVEYRHTTVEELALSQEGRYDAVVASEVVEHVSDIVTFMEACCKLIKPGGSLFITTLNKTSLSYILGVVAAEQVLRIVPAGTHDWNKFVPPEDLQYILDKNGFATRLIHGMCYNPLTKKWTWIKDTNINYAVHALKGESSVESGSYSSEGEKSSGSVG